MSIFEYDAESYEQQLEETAPDLGYRQVKPLASQPVRLTGSRDSRDPVQQAVERIVREEWPVAFLRQQITELGGDPYGRARIDLAQQLVEIFLDPSRILVALASLRPETQDFFVQLLLNLRILGYLPGRQQIFMLRPFSTRPEMLYEEILEAGLGLDAEGGLVFPEILMPRLPELYLSLPTLQVPGGTQVLEGDPQRLLVSIQQFVGLVQSEAYELRPTRTWSPFPQSNRSPFRQVVPTPESARSFKKANRPPSWDLKLMAPEPQPEAAALSTLSAALGISSQGVEFLYYLLSAGIIFRPGSPIHLEAQRTEEFLALPPGRQLAQLLTWYEWVNDWSAFWPLWRAGEVEARLHYRPYVEVQFLTNLQLIMQRLRSLVLDYLSFLPHDTWLGVEEVLDPLLRLLPEGEALLSVSNLELVSTFEGWEGFLELYLRAMARGPLRWLGLADVLVDEHDVVIGLRLHHLQDLLWKRRESYPLDEVAPREERPLTWLPDEEALLVPPPVPGPLIRHLQQWARPAGMREDALLYEADVERLHRAFEAGETPESLSASWVESAGPALPEPVPAWWQGWWARYGRVRLYPHQAALITSDDFTLQELQVAVPELPDALLGLVNARTALLDGERAAAVVRGMEAKGYLPKVEE
ncbi:MAG: hypothetical protein ACLFU8_10230 [Anaerolineales bacterium]